MSERVINDPTVAGWELDSNTGYWMWAAGGGGSIQDGDTEGQITTWDGTEWTPEGAVVVNGSGLATMTNGAKIQNNYLFMDNGGVDFRLGYDGSGGSMLTNVSNHYMRFATNDIERLRIDADGNVNITGKLFVNGVELGGGGGGLWTDNGDGSISYSGVAKATNFQTT